MTTTSDSVDYIDCAAFDIGPEALFSLRALAAPWRTGLNCAAEMLAASTMLEDFIERSAELPLLIANADWQQRWMRSWNKLSSRGFSLADMFGLFNRALAYCETDLFGEQQQPGRIQLDLFAILRRSVNAAISCIIEMDEEARASQAGLPGEFAAMHRLRELAASGQKLSVLSVSMVNERALAHLSAGDLHSIPSLLSVQLSSVLRPQDRAYVGHEGEWLLLLHDVNSLALPALAATQIRRAFGEPLILASGRSIALDVVIGAAMMPEHGCNPEDVIQASRLARRSLLLSGEPFAMFDDAMKQAWQQRHELSDEIRLAMRHETLMLYLQPQVDAGSGRCFGAELLLRWQRPGGAWVRPELLVEIIEENGWRGLFTDWLIRSALRLSSELDAAGVDVALSLNLIAGDLLDADLPELVAQCLETWRLPASRFTFELTESAMMGDRDRALAVMTQLRALGIRLALDDFGTGYSSLSYLATLPLNEIKIDRSFVVAMSASAEGLRVVRAIVDLTHDLGMRSLAEGVETVAQRDQLLALGCKDVQGFLYGRAMPLGEFVNWCKTCQP